MWDIMFFRSACHLTGQRKSTQREHTVSLIKRCTGRNSGKLHRHVAIKRQQTHVDGCNGRDACNRKGNTRGVLSKFERREIESSGKHTRYALLLLVHHNGQEHGTHCLYIITRENSKQFGDMFMAFPTVRAGYNAKTAITLLRPVNCAS